MKINWMGYYPQYDGYGRFNSRMVNALTSYCTDVEVLTRDHAEMPDWMLRWLDISWHRLTISCMPATEVRSIPGRHWLYSMVESSLLPKGAAERINASGVERVIVPCEHNATAFKDSGVIVPISVVPGGTDPIEFPLDQTLRPDRPYTFLTLADRGFRKGWEEVWQAFYLAFGGKTGGDKDVRLIIKVRPHNLPDTIRMMKNAEGADERVHFQIEEVTDMQKLYQQADCLVLPSRCEGWGMPHREAASMGLPVITQKYSGLDDGFIEQWSLPVQGGKIQPLPKEAVTQRGEWMIADKHALAEAMFSCYRRPEEYRIKGRLASEWIRENQTWKHTAKRLMDLAEERDNAFSVERAALPV